MLEIIESSYHQFLDILLNSQDQDISSLTSYINQYCDDIDEAYRNLYFNYLSYMCQNDEDKEELLNELKKIKYRFVTVETKFIYNDEVYYIYTPYSLTIDALIQEILDALKLDEKYRYHIYTGFKNRHHVQHYEYIYEIDYYDFFYIQLKDNNIHVVVGDVEDVPTSIRNN